MIHAIRRRHAKLGGKKLYKLLKADMEQAGIKMGRDKFFEFLAENALLVKRKRKYGYTTDSYHRFRVYKNKLKDRQLCKAHQAWVCDITYIRLEDTFMYLFLITDAYSRKIVGWHLSPSLAMGGALQALKMAIKQCPDPAGLIHHSDRGIQYCSHQYVAMLKKAKIEISMTQENHCYENSIAERANGILKQEYALDGTFYCQQQLAQAVKEGINSYNTGRPHWSLDLATPQEVHQAA